MASSESEYVATVQAFELSVVLAHIGAFQYAGLESTSFQSRKTTDDAPHIWTALRPEE